MQSLPLISRSALINTLSGLVSTYFHYSVPIHLAVISAYNVPPAVITFPDSRYEARTAYVSVQAQGAAMYTDIASNLDYLAQLAWTAGLLPPLPFAPTDSTRATGFDFIQFRNPYYLQVSTIPNGCSTDLDLAFLLDGSGSVTAAGFAEAQSFVLSLSSYFVISPARTRVSVTTFSGPLYSNLALLPNSSNCPQGSIWEAHGLGCICPQYSACSGPQFNQFTGPSSGCRAGQFEVVPGACTGSDSPTWVPSQHPNCQYPRQYFDFNCTTCSCVPWGGL